MIIHLLHERTPSAPPDGGRQGALGGIIAALPFVSAYLSIASCELTPPDPPQTQLNPDTLARTSARRLSGFSGGQDEVSPGQRSFLL